ncbi:proline--tRNA ligase, cytoplasmic [Trifolium repens]|nr:proline--tRNA ligase, cytoplasmic [Trifolium repens]
MLCEAKISAELDSRDYCSPERKYSEWEMKGVPLRIEIGTKDLANEQVVELDVIERTENVMGAAKIVCVPFDQPELIEGINY